MQSPYPVQAGWGATPDYSQYQAQYQAYAQAYPQTYSQAAYSGYQDPNAYYYYQQQQAAYQQQQANSMALTLYSAWTPPGLNPETPDPAAKPGAPKKDPYCPGLEALPTVPAPVTFVKEDPKRSQFPNSSKSNPEDPLNWITPTIFDSMTQKVEEQKAEQRVPLRELSSTKKQLFQTQF